MLTWPHDSIMFGLSFSASLQLRLCAKHMIITLSNRCAEPPAWSARALNEPPFGRLPKLPLKATSLEWYLAALFARCHGQQRLKRQSTKERRLGGRLSPCRVSWSVNER
eukprot:1859321-Prymnesium_polylepis.1